MMSEEDEYEYSVQIEHKGDTKWLHPVDLKIDGSFLVLKMPDGVNRGFPGERVVQVKAEPVEQDEEDGSEDIECIDDGGLRLEL